VHPIYKVRTGIALRSTFITGQVAMFGGYSTDLDPVNLPTPTVCGLRTSAYALMEAPTSAKSVKTATPCGDDRKVLRSAH